MPQIPHEASYYNKPINQTIFGFTEKLAGKEMMEEQTKDIIHLMYRDLAQGNIKHMLDFFLDDSVLTWGPFRFEGKTGIESWAKDLLQMFAQIGFVEEAIHVSGKEIHQALIIRIVGLDSIKGQIRALATYEIEKGKFKRFEVKLLDGSLFIPDLAKRYGDLLKSAK